MDGVVLVVHAEKTRWEVAQRVKEHLEMANTNILGVLLNKKKYVIPKFIYNRMK
jgi:Mrp family chromosome partitioning ATPase